MPLTEYFKIGSSKLIKEADIRIFFSSVGTCASIFCGYYVLVVQPTTTTPVFITRFHNKEATALYILCDCEVLDA
jgi:uncharacterized membrane protein